MGRLVLTRNHGESIKIGEDITVTLTGNFRGQVKVMIEAPNDIKIHRLEFYEKIKKYKNVKMINTKNGITKSFDEWYIDYKICREMDCLDSWYGYELAGIENYPENWWETDFLKIVE